MFPFIRLFLPFRHYLMSVAVFALLGFQISQQLQPYERPLQTDDPRLADAVAYEALLKQKAENVVKRFGADSYTVDLCVTLDHVTTTTTTFDPGKSSELKPEAGETWQEEVSTSPKVRHIKVCITIDNSDAIDQDQLFRSLSYSLGIDLARGDMLRLVSL